MSLQPSWRRQVLIPNVTRCVDNPLPTALTRLPRNRTEGDIPLMAMVTGNVDALECVLRKIGIDNSEFTTPAGGGRVQLFVANGAVSLVESLRGRPYPYHQRNQLFHSEKSKKFSDVTAIAGPPFQLSGVGRGAAFGDIDNDGRVDVIVSNNNGPVRLLLNQAGSDRSWLTVRLAGRTGNVSGAVVGLTQHNGATVWRRAHADGSYLSSSDPRVHFGLGSDASGPSRIEVRWPSGRRETWSRIKIDSEITLHEGRGAPLP